MIDLDPRGVYLRERDNDHGVTTSLSFVPTQEAT